MKGFSSLDRKFAGADTLATSYVLSQAIKYIHEHDPVDMFFFGKQAIDGDTAQVGPGVAVRLGIGGRNLRLPHPEIDVGGAKRRNRGRRKTGAAAREGDRGCSLARGLINLWAEEKGKNPGGRIPPLFGGPVWPPEPSIPGFGFPG